MTEFSSLAGSRGSVLRVAWAAHKNAKSDIGDEAEKFMLTLLSREAFIMTDHNPDIIIFMTGGSEARAVSLIQPGRPVLLLTKREINSYPAATEVMAWAINNNIRAVLSDGVEARETGLLDKWRLTCSIVKGLNGTKAGLVGSVSDWLVASATPKERLQDVFNIKLETIPWPTLPDYAEMVPDKDLLGKFSDNNFPGLEDAARVLSMLRKVKDDYELNAMAVECFSLVQERKVTACMALAQLNAEGTVAACEGDLTSMAGMMLLSMVSGNVPWMANTTRVTDRSLLLSHCTISVSMVKDIKLMTHYETDCSVAIKGRIDAKDVTIFRLSENLDRAFIAEGKITAIPSLPDACRTQAEIEIPEKALGLLRTHPLGNHLLLVPGKYAGLLEMVCWYKGITVIS
jgi:L-fucose isomerase-like protein